MKGVVRDFRPYETPLIVREDTDMTILVSEFVKNPALHHICVVNEEKRLLGLINRKRLFKHIFLHHIAPDTRVSNLLGLLTAEKSSDLMITHLITCSEDDSIYDVIKNLIEHKIREMPVLDREGRVLGFITILMIMKKWLGEEDFLR